MRIIIDSLEEFSKHEIDTVYYDKDDDVFTAECYCGMKAEASTLEEAIKTFSEFGGHCAKNWP